MTSTFTFVYADGDIKSTTQFDTYLVPVDPESIDIGEKVYIINDNLNLLQIGMRISESQYMVEDRLFNIQDSYVYQQSVPRMHYNIYLMYNNLDTQYPIIINDDTNLHINTRYISGIPTLIMTWSKMIIDDMTSGDFYEDMIVGRQPVYIEIDNIMYDEISNEYIISTEVDDIAYKPGSMFTTIKLSIVGG